jgi:hypothetical protein
MCGSGFAATPCKSVNTLLSKLTFESASRGRTWRGSAADIRRVDQIEPIDRLLERELRCFVRNADRFRVRRVARHQKRRLAPVGSVPSVWWWPRRFFTASCSATRALRAYSRSPSGTTESCSIDTALARRRLRVQNRPSCVARIVIEIGRGNSNCATGAAGGLGDERRRRRVQAERHASGGCHHRLLHAHRRRRIRLWPHRRRQRALGRLRDGWPAAVCAGRGRHADQRSCQWKRCSAFCRAARAFVAPPAFRLLAVTRSTRPSRSTVSSASAWSIRTLSSATAPARPGDLLILTKPLGVGLMATAHKRGLLDAAGYARLVEVAAHLNSVGAPLGALDGVHAMTDVTGFSLLGHALEVARGSGVGVEISVSSVPFINRGGCARAGGRRHWRRPAQLGQRRRASRLASGRPTPTGSACCSPIRKPMAAC